MREVAINLAVCRSRDFLTRRRSRIWKKQDLVSEEMWSANVKWLLNMIPRFRAESTGVSTVLSGICKIGFFNFANWEGWPKIMNSEFDGFRLSRLEAILLDTDFTEFCNWSRAVRNEVGLKER
jgi:hypothetical protein